MNRRKFLATLGLGATGLAISRPALLADEKKPSSAGSSAQPKNLIVLVSDGMSHGTLAMANQYHIWQKKGPCNWIRMLQQGKGRRAMMDMASLNSIVTDSAAAASSWGGGARVRNGSLNVSPDGKWNTPLWVKAKAAGKSTGLVTTAPMAHATPAGFAANSASRNSDQLVAEQYLERGIDVLMGGGKEAFLEQHRSDKKDLLGEYQSKGYDVVQDRKQLREAESAARPLLGLFSHGWLPYEIDRKNRAELEESVPSLVEMMEKALQRLTQNKDGFVLMVEGAKVDYAAHQNDFAGLIFDQLAFDECIGLAEAFCDENPDTLLVVCTDHGNANPGMNAGDNQGAAAFRFLDASKGSYQEILRGIGAKSTLDDWKERIRQYTGVELSKRDSDILQQYIEKLHIPVNVRYASTNNFLGQILANSTQVGWVGNNHTSDYVELMAVGAGSESIPLFIRNEDLHHYLVEQLSLPDVVIQGG
jgi:alkaline phosphatase